MKMERFDVWRCKAGFLLKLVSESDGLADSQVQYVSDDVASDDGSPKVE